MKKNKPKQNAITKKKEATRQETLRKKQQAQTERSHRRKEEEATRNGFMGVLRGKYKRQEEGKGTKRKHQHQKNRKPHLQLGFKEASTQGLQTDLRGFSHKAAVWKILRRKENEIKTKMEKEQTQTKRKHQSLQ